MHQLFLQTLFSRLYQLASCWHFDVALGHNRALAPFRMDLAETAGYVKHHVGLAGRSDPLFSDDAVALIHQTSRGIPRAINNLAVHSLVAAFADSKGLVDESSARAAVVEVHGD